MGLCSSLPTAILETRHFSRRRLGKVLRELRRYVKNVKDLNYGIKPMHVYLFFD